MGSSTSKKIRRHEETGQKRNIRALDSVAVDKANTGPAPSSSPNPIPQSWYHSARIQRMMEKRDEFSSKEAFDIDSSRVTWSELDPTCKTQRLRKTNRKFFEVLKRKKYVRPGVGCIPDDFIEELDWLVVGKKIAEGGQAEIFEARWFGEAKVLKVFKACSLLQDLEKQLPPGMFHWFNNPDGDSPYLPGTISAATLLKDESLFHRFAFVMERCWGDLRKLIDQQMLQSGNQGPPFAPLQTLGLMFRIAHEMNRLHIRHPPVLHRDLKAANVLVHGTPHPFQDEDGVYKVTVADFECSVGVGGTGFWRAPEIFQQLKDKVPLSDLEFTCECDVYSFGMTCYEIVSGRIPFEDVRTFSEGRELVLKGERPELPSDLDPFVRRIITSCWNPIPLHRPSFKDIRKDLNLYYRIALSNANDTGLGQVQEGGPL